MSSFDTIILRGGGNDRFTSSGIVDEFVRRTQLSTGQRSAHGTFVHLYINGAYWGIYNPLERPIADFGASYYCGEKEEWDAVNSGQPTGESLLDTWNAMLTAARQGVQANDRYQYLQGNDTDGSRNPAKVHHLDVPESCRLHPDAHLGGHGRLARPQLLRGWAPREQ